MATTLTKPQVLVNQTKIQLEEKIESITEGALPPYLKSMFSDLASANLQNAQILYNFLLIGHLEQNLALRTSLNHMQILCYFNRYLAYKTLRKNNKGRRIELFSVIKEA